MIGLMQSKYDQRGNCAVCCVSVGEHVCCFRINRMIGVEYQDQADIYVLCVMDAIEKNWLRISMLR